MNYKQKLIAKNRESLQSKGQIMRSKCGTLELKRIIVVVEQKIESKNVLDIKIEPLSFKLINFDVSEYV